MADPQDQPIEATPEQLARLRELGIDNDELGDLSFSDAEEWIDELQTMREDAGKIGRDA